MSACDSDGLFMKHIHARLQQSMNDKENYVHTLRTVLAKETPFCSDIIAMIEDYVVKHIVSVLFSPISIAQALPVSYTLVWDGNMYVSDEDADYVFEFISLK